MTVSIDTGWQQKVTVYLHQPVIILNKTNSVVDEISIKCVFLQLRSDCLLNDWVHECPDATSDPYSHVVAVF